MSPVRPAANGLRVGPLVRWTDTTRAVVWVETEHPAEVSVLGHSSPTFTVAGHHYALVLVTGLGPGGRRPYEVHLDGRPVWPEPGASRPPSVIVTRRDGDALSLVFGSCRLVGPRSTPLHLDRVLRRYDPDLDALVAFTERLQSSPPEAWPSQLLLLGDQVYADDVPDSTVRAMKARRGGGIAGPERAVADFEDYTLLYRDSWTEPPLRWLLSTMPTAMIFDDHELVDNWDISASWVAEKRASEGWDERLTGALMSYWLYQHLGNLSPEELDHDELYQGVRQESDGADRLRRFIRRVDQDREGSRWAYRRDFGDVRLVVIDSRATRVLSDERRDMLDAAEWEWFEENIGGARHLLIATSVPVFYAMGFHQLQAWSERVAGGAWGPRFVPIVEKLRRSLSLSGWPSFGASFSRLVETLAALGSGKLGEPPVSITILSGDVHHGYVARVTWPEQDRVASPVHQVVTSPFRNPLMPHERFAHRAAASRVGERALGLVARAARVPPLDIRWRRLEGLEFANQISRVDIHGDVVELTTEVARHGSGTLAGELRPLWRRRLA